LASPPFPLPPISIGGDKNDEYDADNDDLGPVAVFTVDILAFLAHGELRGLRCIPSTDKILLLPTLLLLPPPIVS